MSKDARKFKETLEIVQAYKILERRGISSPNGYRVGDALDELAKGRILKKVAIEVNGFYGLPPKND